MVQNAYLGAHLHQKPEAMFRGGSVSGRGKLVLEATLNADLCRDARESYARAGAECAGLMAHKSGAGSGQSMCFRAAWWVAIAHAGQGRANLR